MLPGSANRLMELTENQQEHRQKWESEALGASISDNRRGQWFGFILSIIAIVSAIVGGGAAGGIEHVIEPARCQLGRFGGQHRRRLVAAVSKRIVVLHPRRLLGVVEPVFSGA